MATTDKCNILTRVNSKCLKVNVSAFSAVEKGVLLQAVKFIEDLHSPPYTMCELDI